MAGEGKERPRVTYVKRALAVKYLEKGWEQCPVTRAWLYVAVGGPDSGDVLVFVPGAIETTAATVRRVCYLTGGCPVHRAADLEMVG